MTTIATNAERPGGHVGVLLTKEFVFLLFWTPTWPLCPLSLCILGLCENQEYSTLTFKKNVMSSDF